MLSLLVRSFFPTVTIMEWIREKPTQPGWYWHQSSEHDMRVVELYADGTIGIREGGQVISFTTNQFESRYGHGEWYGPIVWQSDS